MSDGLQGENISSFSIVLEKQETPPHHHHHHISSEEVVFWNFYYIKVVNFGPLWRIKWKCKLLFSLPAIKMPLAMRHWHKDRPIGK